MLRSTDLGQTKITDLDRDMARQDIRKLNRDVPPDLGFVQYLHNQMRCLLSRNVCMSI